MNKTTNITPDKISGFVWRCPNCPKVITSTTEKQVDFNRRSHELICKGENSRPQTGKAEGVK